MDRPLIKGVDHITVNVLDKEATLWFYGEFLGLPKLDVVTLDDQEIRYYELTKDCRLELIDYHDNGNGCQAPEQALSGIKDITALQRSKGCYRHMALLADDLDAVYQMVLERKIPVRMVPTVMEKLGCKGILIEDPNGVEIEIVEKLI